ncbi:2-hydroxyacid dehydrogenase [Kribbella sp. NPDC004536]|uniref:2-hydroxyacid dehydrogenase n=1 Tax=Kribbella sp. NPDC004536 TaxID=3364106 RepID=UPI0036C21163
MQVVVVDPMQVRLAGQLAAAIGPGASLKCARSTDDWHGWLTTADVFVGSKLSAELAAEAPALRLVQVAGAGYDGIALDSLVPGAVVANTFHHGRAIAEYCLMSMLVLSRQLLVEDRALRGGRWRSVFQDSDAPVHETLAGKTVGIIGYGEIGGHVGRLCKALGMRVLATRRTPSSGATEVDWLGGPQDTGELVAGSDFVIVTVPVTARTRNLLDSNLLARMKRSAFLINVARGAVVDESALYGALSENRIAGAAIDVWWQYPASGAHAQPSRFPFGELPNVLMTPHTSGVTRDVFERRMLDVAANIRALRDGDPLHNVVFRSPLGTTTPSTCTTGGVR